MRADDLTERVARALCRSLCAEQEESACWNDPIVPKQGCHCWDTQIPQARAAILETLRAVRDVDIRKMYSAGWGEYGRSLNEDGEPDSLQFHQDMCPIDAWQAMLDHLIKQYEEQDAKAQ